MLRFNSNYQNPLVPPISITETINNAPSQSSNLLPLLSGVRQVFNLNGKYTLDSSNGGGQTTFNLPQVDGVANAVGVAKLYAVISVIVTNPDGSILGDLEFPDNGSYNPSTGDVSLAYPYTGDFDTDADNVYCYGGSYGTDSGEYDQPIVNTSAEGTGWLSVIIPIFGISGVLTGSAALFSSSTVGNNAQGEFAVGSVVHYNYAINALPASNLLTDYGLSNIFSQLQTANTNLTDLQTDVSNAGANNAVMPTQQFFQIAANTTTAQSFEIFANFSPSLNYLVNQSINNIVSFPVQISLFNPESSAVDYTFTASYGSTTLTFTGSATPGLSVIATIPSQINSYSVFDQTGNQYSGSIAITFDTTSANAYLIAEALGIR